MIERRRGSFVGVSSAAGLVGVFGYTAYAPTKFAVRGFLESLRGELLPYGIHVGCSFPPDTDTPQLEDENRYKPKETKAISGTIKPLLGRAGREEHRRGHREGALCDRSRPVDERAREDRRPRCPVS